MSKMDCTQEEYDYAYKRGYDDYFRSSASFSGGFFEAYAYEMGMKDAEGDEKDD